MNQEIDEINKINDLIDEYILSKNSSKEDLDKLLKNINELISLITKDIQKYNSLIFFKDTLNIFDYRLLIFLIIILQDVLTTKSLDEFLRGYFHLKFGKSFFFRFSSQSIKLLCFFFFKIRRNVSRKI